jgi:AraC family transcriptional regulator of adaptative response/methylated-DNA-[protein]-cysteine methyltransferase
MDGTDLNIQYNQEAQMVSELIAWMVKNQHIDPGGEKAGHYLGITGSQVEQVFIKHTGIGPGEFLKNLKNMDLRKDIQYFGEFANWEEVEKHLSFMKGNKGFLSGKNPESLQSEKSAGMSAIYYGIYPSPFGSCFVATLKNAVCAIHFTGDEQKALGLLKEEWPGYEVKKVDGMDSDLLKKIFTPPFQARQISIVFKGTPFQKKVWEFLTRIPMGSVLSYQQVARFIGRPKATRAVANAVAKNPIAHLVPCHRVVRNNGSIGGYQSGKSVKAAILAWEKSLVDTFGGSL